MDEQTDTSFFRAPVEHVEVESKPENIEPAEKSTKTDTTEIEVPYLDYARQKSRPFIADHYKLGDMWNQPDGFHKEVKVIEDYMKGLIENGEIDNSLDSVKARLNEIESVTRSDKETRTVMKLGKISAYIEFLVKTEGLESRIKRNLSKQYGNT